MQVPGDKTNERVDEPHLRRVSASHDARERKEVYTVGINMGAAVGAMKSSFVLEPDQVATEHESDLEVV